MRGSHDGNACGENAADNNATNPSTSRAPDWRPAMPSTIAAG